MASQGIRRFRTSMAIMRSVPASTARHHFVRGPHVGVFVGVPLFVPPAYPAYYPPAYTYEAPAPSYWYYCPSYGAYYPRRVSCPEPWVPVPAQ